MKRYYLLALLTLFSAAFTAPQLYAQDEGRAEAVTEYNAGLSLSEEKKYVEAAEKFRDAIAVATEYELQDIVDLATNQIPRLYLRRASDSYASYQSEKSLPSLVTAIEHFEELETIAGEFGNDDAAKQARNAIPQLYYVKSLMEFRAADYDAAMTSLGVAIERNPNYATAYYQQAIVQKAMDRENIEAALAYYDKAIEVAATVGDSRTLNNATTAAAEELVFRAVTVAEDGNLRRSNELLSMVVNYDGQNADANYRLAENYNKLGQWNNAIVHAERAIEYESGGVVAEAKIYFELGTALKALYDANKTDAGKLRACDAFENANYGDFSAPSTHIMTFELKCDGYTPN